MFLIPFTVTSSETRRENESFKSKFEIHDKKSSRGPKNLFDLNDFSNCGRSNYITVFFNKFSIFQWLRSFNTHHRFSLSEVFLGKGALKIYSKFTAEHPCRINFIKITLWHGFSPLNLLHVFRTPFPKNTSGCLLLIQSIPICRITGVVTGVFRS